jgi:hypothetical protein
MDAPVPSADSARDDLAYVRHVVVRAQQRVDPHAFHFVHWGAIVLVWYPLANVFERMGRTDWMTALGIGAFVLGFVLSAVRERRLAGRERLAGEDPYVGNQVMWAAFASIGAGIVLSATAPTFGFVEGRQVPTLWGLVYASLCTTVGIVYRREFLWGGLAIFAAAVAAMAWPEWNGMILGPAMGLGIGIPGLLAERRVAALAR